MTLISFALMTPNADRVSHRFVSLRNNLSVGCRGPYFNSLSGLAPRFRHDVGRGPLAGRWGSLRVRRRDYNGGRIGFPYRTLRNESTHEETLPRRQGALCRNSVRAVATRA